MTTLRVTTDKEYEAELSVATSIDGFFIARAAAIWRGIRTPAIDLKAFDNKDAATRYIERLRDAFMDVTPDVAAEVSQALGS